MNSTYCVHRDERVIDFVTPQRIAASKGCTEGNLLLASACGQASTAPRPECLLVPGGWLVLDFGCELHGGIEITAGGFPESERRLLISFGESFSETFSHPDYHHTRQEMELSFVPWSTLNCGELGFRFVKLENREPFPVGIQSVRVRFLHREFPDRASFKCSDPLLNDIWKTSVHTLELCLQNYVWDGVKRDRLVWMGDLFAELIAAGTVFGHLSVVEKSLDFLRDETPLPCMMNGCETYSVWWVLAQRFWFRRFGSRSYLCAQREYLKNLLELFAGMVDKDGKVHFTGGFLLLDWATGTRAEDAEAILAGCYALLLLAFRAGAELCEVLGETSTVRRCEECANRMARRLPPLTHSTADNAFQVLAGLRDPETIYRQCYEKQLPKGLSTFLGCFALDVCALAGHRKEALFFLRQYWGGMLQLGATTFWEHFDVEWLDNAARIDAAIPPGKRDVHAECGEGCYKGFRNSFCHGWAAMPAEWLIRHLCGIAFENAETVHFQPDLCGLEHAECTVPTDAGAIHVRITPDRADIDAPPELRIIKKKG